MENLILIGMPGAGKSTIGVILAKTLGKRFVDIDLIIQEKEKRRLQDIINTEGMSSFLKIEEEAVRSISGNNMIIATGGSVVYKEQSMKHLKRLGTIIYLDLNYEEIAKRVRNISTRGIAMSPEKTLEDIYYERIKLYKAYEDLSIKCDGLSVEEIINRILMRLGINIE